MEARFNQDWVQ